MVDGLRAKGSVKNILEGFLITFQMFFKGLQGVLEAFRGFSKAFKGSLNNFLKAFKGLYGPFECLKDLLEACCSAKGHAKVSGRSLKALVFNKQLA